MTSHVLCLRGEIRVASHELSTTDAMSHGALAAANASLASANTHLANIDSSARFSYDTAGNLKTVQSGTQTIGGTVNVGNFPATQTVAGTVNVGGIVSTREALPTNAFSVGLVDLFLGSHAPIAGPDPAGTRYAVSSVIFTNSGTGSAQTEILSVFVTNTGSCPVGQVGAGAPADGPHFVVPAGTTLALTFPQPFVTATATTSPLCLDAANFSSEPGASVRASVVGYKILP